MCLLFTHKYFGLIICSFLGTCVPDLPMFLCLFVCLFIWFPLFLCSFLCAFPCPPTSTPQAPPLRALSPSPGGAGLPPGATSGLGGGRRRHRGADSISTSRRRPTFGRGDFQQTRSSHKKHLQMHVGGRTHGACLTFVARRRSKTPLGQ